jgi:hypothetical protein
VYGFLASRLRGKKNRNKRKAIADAVMSGNRTSAAPVAYNVKTRKPAPRFRSTAGKYIVSNREYINVVTSAQNFNLAVYNIQPGIASTFPWLSSIANTHQRYRFTKLKFTYVPVASTSERGRVALAFSIDPLDVDPINSTELFQYPNSKECSVWAEESLEVNLTTRSSTLFTRVGYVADTDIKTYDLGKLYVATSLNAVGDIPLGQLFVDYEVELHTPKPAACPAAAVTDITPGSTLFGSKVFQVPNTSVALSENRIHLNAPGSYFILAGMSAVSPGIWTLGPVPGFEPQIELLAQKAGQSLWRITTQTTGLLGLGNSESGNATSIKIIISPGGPSINFDQANA